MRSQILLQIATHTGQVRNRLLECYFYMYLHSVYPEDQNQGVPRTTLWKIQGKDPSSPFNFERLTHLNTVLHSCICDHITLLSYMFSFLLYMDLELTRMLQQDHLF